MLSSPEILSASGALTVLKLNLDARVVAALHAPTSKTWSGFFVYPFLGDPVNGEDPSACCIVLRDRSALFPRLTSVSVHCIDCRC